MTVLITVWGASPGIGKSTLCAGLSQRLADAGLYGATPADERRLGIPALAAQLAADRAA